MTNRIVILSILIVFIFTLAACSPNPTSEALAVPSPNAQPSSSVSALATPAYTESSVPTDSLSPSASASESDFSSELSPSPSASLLPAPDVLISEMLSSVSTASFFDHAVFLGDSITVGLKNYVTDKRKSNPGFLGDAEFLAEVSYTLAGTQRADGYELHPLYNGARNQPQKSLKAMGAKKVFIMMGVNDMSSSESSIISNYKHLISVIQETNPGIEIYIISIFPMTEKYEDEDRNNTKINYVNTKLRQYAYRENIPFIDMTPSFQVHGVVDENLYSDNYVHINSDGYEIYTKQLILMSKLFSLSGGELAKIANVSSPANARIAPDTNAEILAEIDKGSVVQVLESDTDGWYKILFENQEMYVHDSVIDYSGDGSLAGQVVNVEEYSNLRTIPSTGTTPLGSIALNQYITIIPDYYNQYWYRAFYNGEVCYIYKSNIQ